MKAAVVLDARRMEVQDLPRPTIRNDELLLKVRYSGICGSDLHLYKYCLFNPPAVLGHECSAEVVEVGKKVPGWKVGDKVLAHGGVACGVCADCLAGSSDLCLDAGHMGLGRRPGAYAEYLRAAPQMLVRLLAILSLVILDQGQELPPSIQVPTCAPLPEGGQTPTGLSMIGGAGGFVHAGLRNHRHP